MDLDLRWLGDLRFAGESAGASITLDSDGVAGPSPVQALAFAIAGCMGMDLIHILTKARVPPRALSAHLRADRATTEPRRITRVELRFLVEGAVPAETVERAIRLSREKYCSVWHSMRSDIELVTGFEQRS